MTPLAPKTYARPFSAPVARPLPLPQKPGAVAGGAAWQPSTAATTVVPARRPAAQGVSSFTAAAVSSAGLTGARGADLKLAVFDSSAKWQAFYTGPAFGDPKATAAPFAQRVSQRVLIAKGDPSLGPDGAIFTETRAVVKAPPERILAQLRDPHFWSNGAVDHWVARPDGSFTYALWPAGKLAGVKVNETMLPPERLPDGSYVVRIKLSRQGDGSQLMPGQASGLAYILVKPRPDGSSEVYGRFAGVEEHAPLFSPENFAKNHLLGERGELQGQAAGVGFINHLMPSGTGFGAMLQRAEQGGRP